MTRPSREYIYGINPAFEVLRAGRRTVYEAYLNEASRDTARLRKLADQLERRGIPIQWVDKGRTFQLAESKEHQGVVLKTSPYPYARFEDLRGRPRLLLLDNVEDPHNVGAVLRSAEVFGFHHILLPLKGVPDIYPSVVKVSAGASEHLQIVRDHSANHYVRELLADEYTVVALDAAGRAGLDDLPPEALQKMLLVIGGEAAAVGQFILNNAQFIVGIEQRGRVNSLNASVAAGIAMYALARR
jgi:23S rRNA (guanosine2251-2'-O)-methyltransferase